MRHDKQVAALQKRRNDLQAAVFASPPQNYEEFKQRLGVWIGVGDALNIIEDIRKAELKNEDRES